MQNRNEFIQVSKVLLNNLIHSSSFGRNCGLWLMYWARQKVHSWSHLHLIYNCQKTAHQPFPREERAEVGFILVNATTEMANEYPRQGKAYTWMLAAENTKQNFGARGVSYNPGHFQACCAGKRFFRCEMGGKGKQNQPKKPTGIKTQVPADTVKQINQLMK